MWTQCKFTRGSFYIHEKIYIHVYVCKDTYVCKFCTCELHFNLSKTSVHEQEIKTEYKFLYKDRISNSNLQKKKEEGRIRWRIRPKRESGVLTTWLCVNHIHVLAHPYSILSFNYSNELTVPKHHNPWLTEHNGIVKIIHETFYRIC